MSCHYANGDHQRKIGRNSTSSAGDCRIFGKVKQLRVANSVMTTKGQGLSPTEARELQARGRCCLVCRIILSSDDIDKSLLKILKKI